MSLRKQSASLEEPYKSIQESIENIREKLNQVNQVNQVNKVNKEIEYMISDNVQLDPEFIGRVKDISDITKDLVSVKLKKLLTLSQGWSEKYYQDTLEFINALNEKVNEILVANALSEDSDELLLYDYVYALTGCINSLEKLYRQSDLIPRRPLCSVKSLTVFYFYELVINSVQGNGDEGDSFENFLDTHTPSYIPSDVEMPYESEEKNIFVMILDSCGEQEIHEKAGADKLEKMRGMLTLLHEKLHIDENSITDGGLDEKPSLRFRRAYSAKDGVLYDDCNRIIAAAIKYGNEIILNSRLLLTRKRLIEIFKNEFESYKYLMDMDYIKDTINSVFDEKEEDWVNKFHRELEAEFNKKKNADNPNLKSIMPPIDQEIKDEAEQEDSAEIQRKLTELTNQYGAIKLKEKLDKLFENLEKFEQPNDKVSRTQNLAIFYTRDFQKVLTAFADQDISVTENISNPFARINEDRIDMAPLRACAQVITLCQVVNQWHKQSQSIVSQITSETYDLPTSKQRQYKRFLYLQYIQALQMQQFIDEQWGSCIQYDPEQDCYTLHTTDQTIQLMGTQALQSVDPGDHPSPTRTVSVSSIGTYSRGLLKAAHEIRCHTRFKKSSNNNSEGLFGKLCKAVFIEQKIAKAPIPKILKKFDITADKSVFNSHAQLTICFLAACPDAVSLPIELKPASNIRIESVDSKNLTPLTGLQTFVVPDDEGENEEETDEILPSLAVTITTEPQFNIQIPPAPNKLSGHHPLLVNALKDNTEVLLPIYLTGKLAGLFLIESLGLWPDAYERISQYLQTPGSDIDLLITGYPNGWPTLKKLPLTGKHGQQYQWQLWTNPQGIEYSISRDTTIQVGLDVVQLNCGNEAFPDSFIRGYKATGSCVSILDSFALRVSREGRYQLVSGDLEALKTQLQDRQLALAHLEQLEANVQQFADDKLSQADIDATGSKLLKFFDGIVCLNYISRWRELFNIEPQSLVFIQQQCNVLNRLIETIGFRRKQSFLAKIFNKAPDYVDAYLKLLLTFGLLNGFLHLNLDTLPKDKMSESRRGQFKKFNLCANNLVKLLTVDVKKLDENVRAFLALAQYFSHPPSQPSATKFLKSVTNYYNESLQQQKARISQKLHQSHVQFRQKRQQELCSLLTNPQPLPPPTNQTSIVRVWSQSYTPPELKQDDPSSISTLIEQQSTILQREIKAKIANNIANYRHIKGMPKAMLAVVILQNFFSVYLVNRNDDVVQKLAVFYMKVAKQHYTFTGVFEKQVETESSETEVTVFATPDTLTQLHSLKLLQFNIELTYVIIGPYLGTLREWSACEQLKVNPTQAPILKALLMPIESVADPHESKLTGSELSMTLNPKQREAIQKVLAAVEDQPVKTSTPQVTVIKGPPGTGKTQVICELTTALQAKGVQVLIVAHNNEIVGHIANKLMQQTHVTLACKTRLPQAQQNQQIRWSLERLKDWVRETLTELTTVKPASTAMGTLHKLIAQVKRTMPLFAPEVNKILIQLISKIAVQKSIDDTMISPVISQIMNLFPKRNRPFQATILATVEVMVGTLHGLAAHDMTQVALQWRSSIIEKDRKLVVIMDEASQAQTQAMFPLCLTTAEQLNHLVFVGDPNQLEATSHSKPAPKSVLELCIRNLDPSRIITLSQSYRANEFITQLWSDMAYQGEVVSALPEADQRRYSELRNHESSYIGYLSKNPVTLIDTRGQQKKKSKAYSNKQEAQLAVKLTLDLIKTMLFANPLWLQQADIWVAIITMYRGQLEEIEKRLKEKVKSRPWLAEWLDKIKILTVDGAQGREALYTIVCTTRTLQSSNENPLGHLANPRRLNVALSRAQVGLIILAQLKLFKAVTQAITIRVVDDFKAVENTKEEGVFIQRTEVKKDETVAKTQAVTCLAKGYYGKSVWCMLHQTADGAVQASVLTHREGSPLETWSLPNEVKLTDIQSEQVAALDLLKYILLNLLTTADEPYLVSTINWLILLNRLDAHASESSMIVSQQTVMSL